MSNSTIDNIYNFALKNGALGGKLIGAGGEGFDYFIPMIQTLKSNEKKKIEEVNFDLSRN